MENKEIEITEEDIVKILIDLGAAEAILEGLEKGEKLYN